MSRLSKFSSAPIEISEDGVSIKIYPLLAKRQHLFDNLSKTRDEDERLKVFGEIVKKSLRDEEVTDEEVNNMTLKVQNMLMDAIIEVNGFSDKIEQVKNEEKKKLIRKNKSSSKTS